MASDCFLCLRFQVALKAPTAPPTSNNTHLPAPFVSSLSLLASPLHSVSHPAPFTRGPTLQPELSVIHMHPQFLRLPSFCSGTPNCHKVGMLFIHSKGHYRSSYLLIAAAMRKFVANISSWSKGDTMSCICHLTKDLLTTRQSRSI